MPHHLAIALALLAAAPPASPRRPLAIASASSLRPAAEALEAAFEAERTDVDVVVTLGASGAFFAQARQGAPFDLLLSADREYPRRLVEATLATGPEVVYAVGRLVAWVPAGSPIDLERRGLAALAGPEVRHLAIANPAVAPFGRAAEAALASAGILEAVRDRLVLGQGVNQAAHFAAAGAADAAILPRSMVLSPELARGRVLDVPPEFHPRQEQTAVVLAAAAHPDLARAFLGFLSGPTGRAILARHGCDLP